VGELERATTEELEAALAARRELGREFEPALVESFVAKIEQRIDAEMATRVSAVGSVSKQEKRALENQFVLGLVSLGTGIPITAIAGGQSGLGGTAIAWAGIVGVNVAHATSLRRRRD
jgi:hypothetical protein